MSFEEAASFPTIATTAYYSLVEVARIEKGETILVHAGAGGTGQFCIQLAQLAGAEVYATTSSHAKKEFLMSRYGIPADHIFYSRNTSFAEAIRQATNGRGVDIIVNSLAGDSLIASWELMAPHGRFLELGRADINGNSNLPMMNFKNNVSFSSIALDYILDNRPALLARMLNKVTDMLVRGDLKLPSPLRSYNVSKITDAFRHLQSGGSVGKIVLKVDPTDLVQVSFMYGTESYIRLLCSRRTEWRRLNGVSPARQLMSLLEVWVVWVAVSQGGWLREERGISFYSHGQVR